MKKNVCLITYSDSPNYGAALQLYATYKIFEEKDCNVKVLDYHNEYEALHDSLKFMFSNAPIKEKVRYFFASFVFGGARNGKRNFKKFYENLEYTQRIEKASELVNLNDIDIFCVGSDQVWNPIITDGFDDLFTLNADVSKKISYASSMGSLHFDGYDVTGFISRLRNFDNISVREFSAQKFLQENHINNVTKVVDPTLLFGRKGWDCVLAEEGIERLLNEKYVLVYALGGCFEKNNRIAHEVAKAINAKVAAITLSNRPRNVDYLLNKITPLQFIELIRNASFVVTNSFHGTCFSLMYERPFYSVRFGANPARSEELLSNCGLKNRLLIDNNQINVNDFENTDILIAKQKLAKDIKKSDIWLEGVLNG